MYLVTKPRRGRVRRETGITEAISQAAKRLMLMEIGKKGIPAKQFKQIASYLFTYVAQPI